MSRRPALSSHAIASTPIRDRRWRNGRARTDVDDDRVASVTLATGLTALADFNRPFRHEAGVAAYEA